jgi:pimeloyl-ACP methyl ester carboxylesterase
MSRATVSDVIELEYETFGDPADPTVLMVMGFTAQMTSWKAAFCALLADHGFHVVRYDNRDCGLSTKLSGRPDPQAVAAAMMSGGEVPEVPYTLSDMAADGIGLLDHLGVDRAVVFGASMGGMIAQTMAIEHPRRVAALVSVMSMPGSPDVGQASEEAMSVLLTPPPTERSAYIENAPNALVWASRRYGDADELRTMAAAAYDRCFYPDGAPRQLAAIFASGDRAEKLAQLSVPTLVIHGRDDTLISPSGGFRTAELIPTAHLMMLADMGHDLPEPLWPVIVSATVAHANLALKE